MKKTVEMFFCDVCGRQTEVHNVNYPVIFHTEEMEGRTVDPHIIHQKIDMCRECLSKTLMLDGYGSNGLNRYSFRQPVKDGDNE